jgi:hypothetical protein
MNISARERTTITTVSWRPCQRTLLQKKDTSENVCLKMKFFRSYVSSRGSSCILLTSRVIEMYVYIKSASKNLTILF